MYDVVISKQALKAIRKLDKQIALALLSWIEKNLKGTDDPRIHGKALKGKLSPFWRYRVGDYRILASIEDKKLTIIIITVGHRKEVYE